MSTTRIRTLRGGLLVAATQVASQIMAFVRNVMLARLLGPTQMGVAAALALVASVIDMTTDVAVDRLLVQAEDGDDPALQAAAHAWQIVRGFGGAALVLATALPMAHLFHIEHATGAMLAMAVLPVLKGFTHLDVKRMQRFLRFWPGSVVEGGAGFLVTAIALPLAIYYRDYHAMVWILIAQAAFAALGSHLFAERPYRFIWQRQCMRRIMRFGWPLLIDGLLLFAILQGDRVIVGARFTMSDLGVYSVAFGLTWMAGLLVTRVASSVLTPLFAEVQKSPPIFLGRYRLGQQLLYLSAAALIVPFVLVGPYCIHIIYGQKYMAAAPMIGVFGAMQGIRLMRVAPQIAMLAKGDTFGCMLTNVVRAMGAPIALAFVWRGGGLTSIAMAGLAAEILALAAALYLAKIRHALPLSSGTGAIALTTAASFIAVLLASARFVKLGAPPVGMTLGFVILAGVAILGYACFPEFRREVKSLWGKDKGGTSNSVGDVYVSAGSQA